MTPAADNALIVQSDCSVLLEVRAPRANEARAALAPFAELVKSPEHVHTYRLTPLAIWNARAAGLAAEQMVEALREHARSRRTSSRRSSSSRRATGESSLPGTATPCVAAVSTR